MSSGAPTILIAGGYGAVGRIIAGSLSAGGFGVIVAGRDLGRAIACAVPLGADARHLDLDDRSTWGQALEDVDAVIVCMDQAETGFAAHILRQGLHYFDVTAGDAFMQAVERLRGEARRASAILSLGLAPGLTNLLAAQCIARLDRADRVNIGILSGLGDEHGPAALDWVAREIFKPDRFAYSTIVDFGAPWNRRRVFNVAFSDQYALMRSFAGAVVHTGLCFDSRPITRLFFWLGRRFAGNERARRAVQRISQRIRTGSSACIVKVAAEGVRDGAAMQVSARFAGEGETALTGKLAALAIARVLRAPPPPGIWHIHQLQSPADYIADVEAAALGRLEFAEQGLSDR